MGRIEILEKLNKELQKDIHEEVQVVYILSRIRKYLELENIKGKYKYLNFYCNWALHAKIDRTESVATILREFMELKDENKFLNFDHLFSELKVFLDDNNLPKKVIEDIDNYFRFKNLLVDIYSDTPVEVYPTEKKVITIKKPETKPENANYVVSFEIKDYPVD